MDNVTRDYGLLDYGLLGPLFKAASSQELCNVALDVH